MPAARNGSAVAAARPYAGRSVSGLSSKKMRVLNTLMRAGNPMISGVSNCSSVTSVPSTSGASRPGRSTGRVTRRNVLSGLAPATLLASSSEGFIDRSAADRRRNTNGTSPMPWTRIMPPMLKTSSGPSPVSPKAARSTTLIQPVFGASRKIQVIEKTMPGTSSGNSTMV